MKIYRPLSPFVLTQGFGENKACVDIETGKNVITCDGNNPPSGYRSLYGNDGHKGIDLIANHGQPVYCVADGTVSYIDTKEKSGLDVRVESQFDGVLHRHIYEHLMGYQPMVGDKIMCGDLIGWAGKTGYASGDHLHFQLEKGLGIHGVAIDPLPFMCTTFAPFVKLYPAIRAVLAGILEKWSDIFRRPR